MGFCRNEVRVGELELSWSLDVRVRVGELELELESESWRVKSHRPSLRFGVGRSVRDCQS